MQFLRDFPLDFLFFCKNQTHLDMEIGNTNREWCFRRYAHQIYNSTANARIIDDYAQEKLHKNCVNQVMDLSYNPNLS